jgi:hypothetical protein
VAHLVHDAAVPTAEDGEPDARKMAQPC